MTLRQRLVALFLFAPLLCQVAPLAAQPTAEQRLLNASFTTISNDTELLALSDRLADTAISEHCAACHGPGLQGGEGVPDLTDFDWLWGITGYEVTATEPIMSIMQTILYGIRDTDCPDEVKRYGACPDTRYSEMPAYRQLGLSDSQLNDLVEYVYSLAGRDADPEAVARAETYAGLCAECHGDDGYGYKPYGGPDLRDDTWLYGDSREAVFTSIADGRLGACPPYWDILDHATIKALALRIYRGYMGY